MSAAEEQNLDAAPAADSGQHFHKMEKPNICKGFSQGISLEVADLWAVILRPPSHKSDWTWLEVHTVTFQVLLKLSKYFTTGSLLNGCVLNPGFRLRSQGFQIQFMMGN